MASMADMGADKMMSLITQSYENFKINQERVRAEQER